MKHEQSIGRRFGTATIVLAIITACANGGDVDFDASDIDAGAKKDAVVADTAKDVGKMCKSCDVDVDCTALDSCPALNDGNVWCCDVPTHTCFAAPMCGGQDAGQD